MDIYSQGGDNVDKLMTLKEVAETLNVSYKTVYRWIKAEKLTAVRVGGVLRVSKEHLDNFLDVTGSD